MAHYEILSNAMCHIVIYLLTGPPQLKMITAVSHLWIFFTTMHLVANYLINSDKNMDTRYKITQKFQVIFS